MPDEEWVWGDPSGDDDRPACAADADETPPQQPYRLMETITEWVAHVVGVCSDAWDGVRQAYDQHTRRDEYRQMQADNDIAASVADLRGVKAMVHARLIELRAESDTHASKVLAHAQRRNTDDALVHFRLKMLYDAQYKHTQSTMSAIEAHIVALEATGMNRRVVRALRRGSAACDEDDEQAAEDAIDDLAEQHSTTSRIIQLLSEAPNLALDDGAVDQEEELQRWLRQQPPPAPAVEGDEEEGRSPQQLSALYQHQFPLAPTHTHASSSSSSSSSSLSPCESRLPTSAS